MDAGIFDLGPSGRGRRVSFRNVEVVFSGAGRVSMKSHCLDQQLLSDYAFLTTFTSTTGFVRNSRRLSPHT
jgi:hypothetical protein